MRPTLYIVVYQNVSKFHSLRSRDQYNSKEDWRLSSGGYAVQLSQKELDLWSKSINFITFRDARRKAHNPKE